MVDVSESHNNRQITIKALRRKTQTIISSLLNPTKVIPSESGLPRDWQGLAELCGISGEKLPSLREDSDPVKKVLDLWSQKDDESTIEKFVIFLEKIDRFDVIDDIEKLVDEDVIFFQQNPNGFKDISNDLDGDKYILTVDDVSRTREGLDPQTYDAFVLFADDDIDFATMLIETMEKEYDLKFCVKDRDLVGGGFEHESVIKLISERCGRLIVIVSPAFLDSPANKFYSCFAQAIGIEKGQRKIIPCLYKSCNVPPELACYFLLDYTRQGKLWNFWKKLYDSLRTSQKSVRANNVNLINRSSSQYNNSLSRQDYLLKSEEVQPKCNSMVELSCSLDTEKIMPDQNMTNSNSADSLGAFPPIVKKNKSFYNRLKKIINPKSTKNGEVKVEPPKVNDIDIEKEKKKHFFSRGSKRKVALAN